MNDNKKRHYIIYQITNKINGKIYIGQHITYDLNDGYMGSGVAIKNAIKKYGLENFTKKIICECSSFEEMNQMEAEIVNSDFVKREDTYNLSVGGTYGWELLNNFIRDNPERKQLRVLRSTQSLKKFYKIKENREKISDRMKKLWLEHPEKFHHGPVHSDTFKKKIGVILSRPGKLNSQYGTHWWKDPNDKTKSMKIKDGDPVPEGWVRGRWQNISEEGKRKISEAGRQNMIKLNKSRTGKICITNGEKINYIYPTEIIPDGWYRKAKCKS